MRWINVRGDVWETMLENVRSIDYVRCLRSQENATSGYGHFRHDKLLRLIYTWDCSFDDSRATVRVRTDFDPNERVWEVVCVARIPNTEKLK